MKYSKKVILIVGLVCVAVCTTGTDRAVGDTGARWLDIKHHDIDLRLWPGTNGLEGLDRVTFEASDKVAYTFYLGQALTIIKAEIDGKSVDVKRLDAGTEDPGAAGNGEGATGAQEDPLENMHKYKLPPVAPGQHVFSVTYRGAVYDTLKVPEGSRSGIPEETTGLIGPEGTYLCGETGWYPDAEGNFSTFSIRVTTPPAVESVTEGKRLSVIKTDRKTVTDWEVYYPTRGLVLVAGEYLIREKEIEGVTLMTYFFPSEEDLVESYLEASERYIRLYNGLIGPYPFSKFAVVENFFPTGLGMPSYTLLGKRVIRLPFIVHTSLGHEVAHNWWGNAVYPDYESGNWCEGLTTYYADYRYQEQTGESAAAQYRRDINVEYTTYAAQNGDMPLIDFRSRKDEVSSVIGYGKCMMVFHMLKNKIGEEKFYRAMRHFFRRYTFKVADWEDIESVFEEVTGSPLDRYFGQWVQKAGAPRLTLEDVRLAGPVADGERYMIEVTIGNEGGFELTGIPVVIVGPDDSEKFLSVDISGKSERFDWFLDQRPKRLEVDPDHQIFRRLEPAEVPVTIRHALSDTNAVVALPTRAAPEKLAAYRELAGRLAASGKATVRDDTSLDKEDLVSAAVFLLGAPGENLAYGRLEPPEAVSLAPDSFVIDGIVYADSGHAAFAAFSNPADSSLAVCAIVGNSPSAIRKAGHKVVYYGKYGYVTFLDGERQVTGEFPVTRSPLVFHFEDRKTK